MILPKDQPKDQAFFHARAERAVRHDVFLMDEEGPPCKCRRAKAVDLDFDLDVRVVDGRFVILTAGSEDRKDRSTHPWPFATLRRK